MPYGNALVGDWCLQSSRYAPPVALRTLHHVAGLVATVDSAFLIAGFYMLDKANLKLALVMTSKACHGGDTA
jgi:hypothetical protein